MKIEQVLQQIQPALAKTPFEALKQQLIEQVAYLIDHDFEKLVRVLYTIDVEEKVLKQALWQQGDQQAAVIIAELMMERQLQKNAARQQPPDHPPAEDEERW